MYKGKAIETTTKIRWIFNQFLIYIYCNISNVIWYCRVNFLYIINPAKESYLLGLFGDSNIGLFLFDLDSGIPSKVGYHCFAADYLLSLGWTLLFLRQVVYTVSIRLKECPKSSNVYYCNKLKSIVRYSICYDKS